MITNQELATMVAEEQPAQFVELIPIILGVIQAGFQLYKMCHPGVPLAQYMAEHPDRVRGAMIMQLRHQSKRHHRRLNNQETDSIVSSLLKVATTQEGVSELCEAA